MGIVIAFLMAFSVFTTSVDDTFVSEETTTNTSSILGDDWGGV